MQPTFKIMTTKIASILSKKFSSIKERWYTKVFCTFLLDGNNNTEISKLIFKARGRNLNIKEHKRWKYEDDLCVGCKMNSESENELLSCPGFCESNETNNEEISYSLVFGDNVSEMIKVAKVIRKRLKVREKLMENG